MKANLSAALFLLSLPTLHTDAQVRYTGEEYRDYYQWFHEFSQTPDFYKDGTTLLTFIEDTPLYKTPSPKGQPEMRLPLGKVVTNIAIPVEEVEFTVVNGYSDQWFLVETCSPTRNVVQGYVWGGHLAKSWRFFQAPDQPQHSNLIALGLASDVRQRPEDIKASLKVINKGYKEAEVILDGFCLFEDCASSSLLRTFDYSDRAPMWIFEASAFTTGCLTGVDKALVSWNGEEMRLVYQAEYTTGHTYASHPFYLKGEATTQICHYQSENEQYDPVWACRTIDLNELAIP
ncbi:MAG: hypothetical protein AAFO02_20230 [Bacteroidota bacterium]